MSDPLDTKPPSTMVTADIAGLRRLNLRDEATRKTLAGFIAAEMNSIGVRLSVPHLIATIATFVQAIDDNLDQAIRDMKQAMKERDD